MGVRRMGKRLGLRREYEEFKADFKRRRKLQATLSRFELDRLQERGKLLGRCPSFGEWKEHRARKLDVVRSVQRKKEREDLEW